MLSHEMHMKTIAKDRYSARLKEAEVRRAAKTNRRSTSMVVAIGKAAATTRNLATVLFAG